MTNTTDIKRISLQCDWDEELRKPGGKAWVSFKASGKETIHGQLSCTKGLAAENAEVTASNGFKIINASKKSITIGYGEGEEAYSCKFVAPILTVVSVHGHKKNVTDLDVSKGGLAVSCDTNGCLKIWTTNNGEVRRDLEGHAGDVYTCRFFPSGIVALSGGADTQLKIWSAETGRCAATLTGHRAGISETAIVERGRNIVSTSRDGTARLWDVGQQCSITTFDELGGAANCCSLGVTHRDLDLGVPFTAPTEREVLTEGKLLLVGTENSHLMAFGLQSRNKVFEVTCDSAVNCCAFISDTHIVCGTQDGTVYTADVRKLGSAVTLCKEERGPVLSLMPHAAGGFIATYGDGSCCLKSGRQAPESPLCELTGCDLDPINRAVSDDTYCYTACRDGFVRKYKL